METKKRLEISELTFEMLESFKQDANEEQLQEIDKMQKELKDLIKGFEKDNTKEFDKMIAEFMSHSIVDDYVDSWGKLMAVVERINTIDDYKYDVVISSTYTSVETRGKQNTICEGYGDDSQIHGTYRAVVKFIEWYNANKQ